MGFGGAKQQVPSPWGEKQFKHPDSWPMSTLLLMGHEHPLTHGPRTHPYSPQDVALGAP